MQTTYASSTAILLPNLLWLVDTMAVQHAAFSNRTLWSVTHPVTSFAFTARNNTNSTQLSAVVGLAALSAQPPAPAGRASADDSIGTLGAAAGATRACHAHDAYASAQPLVS
ncbi:hypothetical protein COO60DRAFT_145432 [Scenedesmus sp. NREL 46B-D3]|nr:hypothetical protein COO60DRAFT_145432 [Scenedesmus sp. NREL 46B-D3]